MGKAETPIAEDAKVGLGMEYAQTSHGDETCRNRRWGLCELVEEGNFV
jgi:hypothetical protein